MASPASYQVALAFTVSSLVDITNDVEEFSIDRGLGTFQRPLEVGQGMVRLTNVYGRYSPGGPSDLRLYTGLGVNITGVSSGVSATRLFTGTIDEFVIDPAQDGPPSAVFRCSDFGKALAERAVYTDTVDGTCVTTIFAQVASFAGLPSSVQAISDDRQWMAIGRGQKGLEAINSLLETGPFTALVGRDGTLAVKDRFNANSTTAINTFTSLWGLTYGMNDESVLNSCRLSFHKTFKGSTKFNITEIENEFDSILIPASSHASFVFDYYDDNTSGDVWASVISSVSFSVNAAADGSGTSRTATTSRAVISYGTSVVASVFNSIGSPVYVWTFSYEAFPIYKKRKITGRFDNASSQNSYGVREIEIDNDLFTTYAACRSCAAYINSVYATPFPSVTAAVRNEYPFILSADVGLNISIVNSITGLDGKFTIMNLSERVIAGGEGWIHESKYELQQSDHV